MALHRPVFGSLEWPCTDPWFDQNWGSGTIPEPLQIDSPLETIPKGQKISFCRRTDACFVKDFEKSIDFLGFWPGCRARTWIVQGHSSDWSGPAPSLFLVTGVALHHQVFLWIGAGACPCTVRVLALHPGQNPKKSIENSKSFTKRASVR